MTRASLLAQRVKCLPTIAETWVWSLGQEDPLEKEMAPYSRTLAWKIPWTEKPGRLQSMGLQRVGHDWATSLSLWITFALPSYFCTFIAGKTNQLVSRSSMFREGQETRDREWKEEIHLFDVFFLHLNIISPSFFTFKIYLNSNFILPLPLPQDTYIFSMGIEEEQ